jgi:pyruvate dehydrogenase E2 component (dihydrolipoamide acetyltransferase)
MSEGVTDQDVTEIPLKGIARTAARRMVAAWEAPMFHLTTEVDMTAALEAKERAAGATLTDLLLRSCALALKDHPRLNAHFNDEVISQFGYVNLGVAVASDAGLVVPVIHGAEQLGLEKMAQARRSVVERARSGALTREDVTGGTFTVSNLGMFPIARFDAILNVPQVAILAVGSTVQRQVYRDGDPAWRPVAELTLTCDHRAVDGATGAAFLARLREVLENVG